MLKRYALGDLTQELASTRRVIEAIPEEHWNWSPHEKSMTAAGLATHLANIVSWMREILRAPEFDLANIPMSSDAFPDPQTALEEFDRRVGEVEEALAAVEDDVLKEEWTLRRGDTVMYKQPKVAALRTFGLSHMIHHRGQLTVYLRLLHAPVPGVYGPSADEMQG